MRNKGVACFCTIAKAILTQSYAVSHHVLIFIINIYCFGAVILPCSMSLNTVYIFSCDFSVKSHLNHLLEQVAISFSRESSQLRGRTRVSCIGRWVLSPLCHQGHPIPHLTHLQNEEITACASPSVGSWSSWNQARQRHHRRYSAGRQDVDAEEKRVAFSNLASFLCSSFRTETRRSRLFWYKSNYQTRRKNKFTDICQSNKTIIAMWGCFFCCLFLEI